MSAPNLDTLLTPSATTARLSLDQVETLARAAMEASGLAPRHAAAVAAQFADAEAVGIPSHGLTRVPSTCAMLKIGKIKGDATPVLTTPLPGILHLEGDDGYPHLGIDEAIPRLAERARANGIASLVVSRAYACNVLGYHTERMARHGLVVLGFTHAPASIAPWGGRNAVLGTNPMSIAVPKGDGDPIVLDQASSVVAKSEVMDRHARGEAIPESWAFDRQGSPTTSAAAALQGGTMAPFGGYKGFGVALIVEILSALLSGSNLGVEAPGLADASTGPSRVGAYFIAIAPEVTGGTEFVDRVTQLAVALDQPGARVPGMRRARSRARAMEDGIEISRALYDELLALAG